MTRLRVQFLGSPEAGGFGMELAVTSPSCVTLAIGAGSSSSCEGLGGSVVPGLGTLGSENAAKPGATDTSIAAVDV